MKQVILALIVVALLAGCVYKNIYVLYDNRGCAFSIERFQDLKNSPNEWNSDYRATIMRLPSEDKSTCPLPK